MYCSLPSLSLFKLSHNRRRQRGLPATTVATTARKEVAQATWATPFVSFLSAALCLHLREVAVRHLRLTWPCSLPGNAMANGFGWTLGSDAGKRRCFCSWPSLPPVSNCSTGRGWYFPHKLLISLRGGAANELVHGRECPDSLLAHFFSEHFLLSIFSTYQTSQAMLLPSKGPLNVCCARSQSRLWPLTPAWRQQVRKSFCLASIQASNNLNLAVLLLGPRAP